MSHTTDTKTFERAIREALDIRFGTHNLGDVDLAIVERGRVVTAKLRLETNPENPEAPVHAIAVEVPLSGIPGPDIDPIDPADWSTSHKRGPMPTPAPTFTDRVTNVADALMSAVAGGEWLPVDADANAGVEAREAAEAEQQRLDDARAKSDEAAAADAAA